MIDPTLVLLGAVGLVIGSFLNVCIHRMPRRESVVWPASRCATCQRALSWYENIPVLSWAVLKGRCRTCGERISVMYPAVEAVTGAVFVAAGLFYGWTPLLAARLLFACAMIVLFVIDLQHRILPNAITVPGILVGAGLSVALPPGPVSSLVGAAAGGGVLWAIGEAYYWWRGVDGLGMGDVKMLAMIGAFLGWQQMLVTLIFASLSGSVAGAALIATRRGDMKAALPFGTFLAVGALVAAVAGDAVLDWYLQFYR